MRRLAIIALLLHFLLPIGAPFLASDGQENLPPCCRRDGKHHCMMMDRASGASAAGLVVKAANEKCPLFPRGAMVSGKETQLVPTASQSLYWTVVSYPAIWVNVESSRGICRSRSHQKRGPPYTLSS